MERLTIQQAQVINGVCEVLRGQDDNGDPIFEPATDVILIAQGAADSVGFVIIGQDSARYITNTQLDAVYILDQLVALCDQIIEIGNTITFAIPSVGIAPNLELQAVAVATQAIKQQIEVKELL